MTLKAATFFPTSAMAAWLQSPTAPSVASGGRIGTTLARVLAWFMQWAKADFLGPLPGRALGVPALLFCSRSLQKIGQISSDSSIRLLTPG